MSSLPILEGLSTVPRTGKSWLYRWCDYVELRCLAHPDARFSRDNLAEALKETPTCEADVEEQDDELDFEEAVDSAQTTSDDGETEDRREKLSVRTFRQLKWRAQVFGALWPFELDDATLEISLRPTERTAPQLLYLQLLLSASLAYCPKDRRSDLTGPFESLSLHVMKALMPRGAEVHQFGAGHSTRYTQRHLYDRLVNLASDLQGNLMLKKEHFSKNDSGDGGLDLVAWHGLGDHRDRLPVALAQCGCTADGWPDKSAQASPERLGANLHLTSDWQTYYFMPLDLTDEINGMMDWQRKSDMGRAVVIDRLRFLNLADANQLLINGELKVSLVHEATALRVA